MANRILRRAEESFREGEVDDCDSGGAFGIGGGEFAADENGLMQSGEVAGSDVWGFEAVVFVFGEGVAFNGVAVDLVIAGEFRIGGGCDGDYAGDPAEGLDGAVDDLRGAVFAVAGVGGIEVKVARRVMSKPTGWWRRLSRV